MTMGISGAGDSAEDQVFYHTGARKTSRAAAGDAVVDGHIVEVKKSSGTTINQVRAVKYITLAVLDTKQNKWFVVPPDEVVRLISKKTRGQHTEIPFESATLSTKNISGFAIQDATHLRDAVIAAAERGERWPALRSAMFDVKKQAGDLATESLSNVHELLRRGPA